MSNSAITGPIFTDVRRSPSGSAAAPSWSFADSTGTGVYLVSAGVLGLSTNGAQRVVVNASGNVGIGTASPRSTLDLGTSRGVKIQLGTAGAIGETQSTAGDYVANNLFVSAEAAGTMTYTKLSADAGNAIIQDFSRGVTFYTGVTGAAAATGTLNNFERVRIEANGKVITKAGLLEQNLTSFSNFNTCLTPMTAFSETAEFVSGFQPANRPDSSFNWWFCRVYSFGIGANGVHYVVQTATSLTGAIYTRNSSNGGSTWGAWSQK